MRSLTFDKWVFVIEYIYSKELSNNTLCISDICYGLRSTREAVVESLHHLISLKFVTTKSYGRINNILLTEEGRELAKRIVSLKSIFPKDYFKNDRL